MIDERTVEQVRSLDMPELAVFRERAETHLYHYYEPEPGLFIAETPMVIRRALDAGYEPVSLLGEEKILEKELPALRGDLGQIPVYSASEEILREIAGYKLMRGLLCAMRRRVLPSVEEVCRNAERIAVLEDVMNPTNVGAIFRSAAAFGLDAVLLTGGCSDPLYRRAARVSVGNVFLIPWTFFPETDGPEKRLAFLKDLGFRTVAMALDQNARDLGSDEALFSGKTAVFLGTEAYGLCRGTVENCDAVVRIPMQNGVDSLNVAAASAVVFWEMQRNTL